MKFDQKDMTFSLGCDIAGGALPAEGQHNLFQDAYTAMTDWLSPKVAMDFPYNEVQKGIGHSLDAAMELLHVPDFLYPHK